MLREVKLTDLKHAFFGRAALNELDEARVAYLRAVVEGGQLLPPIQITPDNDIIDGRTRLRVYRDLNYETIQCEVIAGKTRAEYQALALLANTGGPLPPTRGDVTFVVTQMQRGGASDADILRLLGAKYPKRFLQQQLDWNRSNERLTKFRAAMKLRNSEDLTVKQVAERMGLPEADLRAFIQSGGKRRKMENKFIELQKGFQEPNKSYGEKAKHLFQRAWDAFEGGQLTEQQALQLFRMPGDYGRTLVRKSDDWIERFAAHVSASKKVAG